MARVTLTNKTDKQKLILAIPKGRILKQLTLIFEAIGLELEPAFLTRRIGGLDLPLTQPRSMLLGCEVLT